MLLAEPITSPLMKYPDSPQRQFLMKLRTRTVLCIVINFLCISKALKFLKNLGDDAILFPRWQRCIVILWLGIRMAESAWCARSACESLCRLLVPPGRGLGTARRTWSARRSTAPARPVSLRPRPRGVRCAGTAPASSSTAAAGPGWDPKAHFRKFPDEARRFHGCDSHTDFVHPITVAIRTPPTSLRSLGCSLAMYF